ncbi:hypothetical protein H113_07900 [Trichophyton rubrum MR1459]|uniref:Uncharacterized protein n=1 Tax=Trichophyton rubrum (strain ATCC MYA-4607 / CBS 118892) TaxID=559305 RepID=A0A080WI26_TRIRC|nr:uncharacterized protein TERG_11568 [Trichophyton rubrum CBS 118892]EZF91101.1 hypothetical protein H113_07900 [Trichophyton rubrum MR1459]KFL60232.1 hypothetical protein TERG_11568 [Trichophyton rubrum CBS 118892]
MLLLLILMTRCCRPRDSSCWATGNCSALSNSPHSSSSASSSLLPGGGSVVASKSTSASLLARSSAGGCQDSNIEVCGAVASLGSASVSNKAPGCPLTGPVVDKLAFFGAVVGCDEESGCPNAAKRSADIVWRWPLLLLCLTLSTRVQGAQDPFPRDCFPYIPCVLAASLDILSSVGMYVV